VYSTNIFPQVIIIAVNVEWYLL